MRHNLWPLWLKIEMVFLGILVVIGLFLTILEKIRVGTSPQLEGVFLMLFGTALIFLFSLIIWIASYAFYRKSWKIFLLGEGAIAFIALVGTILDFW